MVCCWSVPVMASSSSSTSLSSSTPNEKVKRADNSSSSSRLPTLEEEVIRLRKENKGLRDECEQLRAAQAETQQRLVSRKT